MRRLFAVLALLAGGLATEAVHPLSCTLATLTRREKIVPNGGRRSPGRGPGGTRSSTGAAARGV
ncbi:hypothetical protein [Paraburkholderia oxyphila]|uniref:hypothetical protein n=1 Tax=Paraburkholderia oxyphila TaxID=614212 RepID=UPI0005BAF281|nr:hypothetical protein [Paraburkholderia oxyphila]